MQRSEDKVVTQMLVWTGSGYWGGPTRRLVRGQKSASNQARVCQCAVEEKREVEADITEALRGLKSQEMGEVERLSYDFVAVRGASSMDPSDSQPQSSGASKSSTTAAPAQKQPGCDVKPRLTKDQHDVLEQHFLAQHKPSTNVKKDFALKLGVPLDKINNWFQNRRAKVKQDRKKMMNQYNMQVGVSYGHPHMPVMPSQFTHHQEQQHAQIPMHQDFYPRTADVSPPSLPVQSAEGPSALDLGPQISLQQQYDMQHSLRSIPEADRTTSYHPNAVMHSIMAATNGAYMHNNGMPINAQEPAFSYDTSGLPDAYSNDLAFNGSLSNDLAPSHPAFTFADFGIDYSTLTATETNTSSSADVHHSTGSISSEPSPFSGGQSTGATQSPNGPTPPSVPSVTSLYTGWTEDQTQVAQPKQDDEVNDQFATPYTLTQASASEQTLPFWGQDPRTQAFPQSSFYQQQNLSAQAVFSSPGQDHARKLSAAPSDFDFPPVFHEDAYARRNSSTSNLANNMDAIHIRNGTPDEFKQPNQPSSIAARRQKRPVALNSTAIRSASYSAPMPSPGGNNDHALRRIRSSGIGNAAGRIQKSQPGSAQRSPMAMSFSDAAASPKFARTFSSSSATTIGQGGSLAPPTPLTPQDFGNYWQSSTVIRPHSVMPEHNSPESMHTCWSVDQPGTLLGKSNSPQSTSLDLQARFANDAMYRDTPPQSAPATQQTFPRTAYTHRPQMRAGFHSTTDLTIEQPKPSHFRRPSLPDTAQTQVEEGNMQYLQSGNINYNDYKDISLNSIHHNIPFAPPVSSMPDFLVHQYTPPDGTDPHGNLIRRATEAQPKSFIFANQGPSDFRAQ
ncbi:uncharacterized protein K460DRAFT_410222 [Cucurbitaria berberidis CBS 394.84]|uniref:Homeobox domain-containing protein n=1 Tax=Cucurbitaria berberidis CBS 394.84 TaxID=1168544 RepID=A0A9P4L4E9_9PLEO|nr:uncharacterized protein K460DRAFT_410222 [Cucurbitaria berberidis CBS 394.84]KAF1840818.1 hypothetical protein K460DRAFT_410222 [Cucurbitaria berberidis CBS 394.84]